MSLFFIAALQFMSCDPLVEHVPKGATLEDSWPSYICQEYSEYFDQLNISLVSMRKTKLKHAVDQKVELRQLVAGNLSMTMFDGDRRIDLTAKIEGYASVLVASRNIGSERLVSPKNTEREFKNIASLWGVKVPLKRLPENGRAMGAIKKGEIIYEDDVGVQLAHRGDRVQLTYETKNIVISKPATVLVDVWQKGELVLLKVEGGQYAEGHFYAHDEVIAN